MKDTPHFTSHISRPLPLNVGRPGSQVTYTFSIYFFTSVPLFLDLSANRSGKNSDNATPKLSKSGKAELRYALYQAALIASYKNMHFIRYYTNKLRGREKEKGIKTKMRVKLAAKLLIIAWTLMKKKEFFDPSYLTME